MSMASALLSPLGLGRGLGVAQSRPTCTAARPFQRRSNGLSMRRPLRSGRNCLTPHALFDGRDDGHRQEHIERTPQQLLPVPADELPAKNVLDHARVRAGHPAVTQTRWRWSDCHRRRTLSADRPCACQRETFICDTAHDFIHARRGPGSRSSARRCLPEAVGCSQAQGAFTSTMVSLLACESHAGVPTSATSPFIRCLKTGSWAALTPFTQHGRRFSLDGPWSYVEATGVICFIIFGASLAPAASPAAPFCHL